MSCSCDNNPLILPVGATGPQGPKGDPGFGFEHYIGEAFDGGVIFHVYKDALNVEHGLIVSIDNQSTSSVYSNIDNQSIGASTTWNGQANTNLMAAQSGASSGAWLDCNNYSYGGFTDWYLPSIDEISLLWQNRYNVNKTLATVGGATQIQYDNYWSSSEGGTNGAWNFYFSDGIASSFYKGGTYYVRAIRQF